MAENLHLHPTDQAEGSVAPLDIIRQRLNETYKLVRIHLARAFQHQKKYNNLRRCN